ncbi:MAG: hypothetical protein QM619_11055 [Micropruina sp.]|uniref:hypothetical protein n=1 Tax=Micropruina sp. TaxID=2737536 RepID=UPI0039E69293
MSISDGQLVKMLTRPEVYVVQGGQRHWIPDPATLTAHWQWSQVTTLPDAEVSAVPLGDPIASVIVAGPWPDGALVTAPPAPEVYVVKGGQRHWIPDPPTLFASGYDWSAVETISSSVMGTIPLGDPISSVVKPTGRDLTVDTGDDFLGAGHYVHTRLRLTRSTGDLSGTNRTWTVTSLGGFHAGVCAILVDADDIPVANGHTPLWRFGVDGKWIGRSDRTDALQYSISPDAAAQVAALKVFHTWAPDSFQTILDKWVAAGKSVSDLATDAGQVVKLFTGK